MFDFNSVIIKNTTPLKRFSSLSAPIDDPPTYSSNFCKCISLKIGIISSEMLPLSFKSGA